MQRKYARVSSAHCAPITERNHDKASCGRTGSSLSMDIVSKTGLGGLSPRDCLKGKSWDEKLRVGKIALIEFGVLKP